MEDHSGYAQWKRGAEFMPMEDDCQWPRTMYSLRDELKNLSVQVTVSEAGLKGKSSSVQEVVITTDSETESCGLQLVDVENGVQVGGSSNANLTRFTGCYLVKANDIGILSTQQFNEIDLSTTEIRLSFASQNMIAGADERVVTVKWQQKIYHPQDYLDIMMKDDSDPVKQELIRYLVTYTIPPNELSNYNNPPTQEDNFIHLLTSTLICTYTNDEKDKLDYLLSQSVITGDQVYDIPTNLKKLVHDPSPVKDYGPVVPFEENSNLVEGTKLLPDDEDLNAPNREEGSEMWIVAAFGEVRRLPSGQLSWAATKNAVLSHICGISKNSFTMQPPLSELGAVIPQRRRDEALEEKAVADYTSRYPLKVLSSDGRYWDQYHYSLSIVKESGDPADSSKGDTESDATSTVHTDTASANIEEERRDMLQKVILAHYRQMQTAKRDAPGQAAGLFSAVPVSESRVHYFGDIMTARGFQSPNLFIRFELVVPKSDWKVDTTSNNFTQTEQKLVCFTQTSEVARVKNSHGVKDTFFAFSMPFELHCVAKVGNEHPRMLLEVHSERGDETQLEGYGVVELPPTPGSCRTVVKCWKPVHSIRENLREFFLSMSSILEDPTFVAIPDGFDKPFINKFGFHTLTTGEVEVRWNCAIQSTDPWLVRKSAAVAGPIPLQHLVSDSVGLPVWRSRSHSIYS
eukprot:TRINITY_DN10490_c0_g1_i1.p1 TRINITY_DN10490_c0_g1~~TRINITY_DN10490_c0_g1_i1.p1  ORF type:complete len:686 (+),score=133.02 TRINITY_DN10490_c0_g1_i1:73-2130(+)